MFQSIPHLKAFIEVITVYQELKFSSGLHKFTLGPQSFAETSRKQPEISNLNVSDFIADVEISARRSLTTSELSHFNMYYKTAYVLADDNIMGAGMSILLTDQSMRIKLGSRLADVGIYPLKSYVQFSSTVGSNKSSGKRVSIRHG